VTVFAIGIGVGIVLGLLVAWGIIEAAGLGEFLRAAYRGNAATRRHRRRRPRRR
jgi:hypothetical protein